MSIKRTYNFLGIDSAFQYDEDAGKNNTSKKIIISDTLSTLNVVNGGEDNGEDNNINTMITHINNIGSNIRELEENCFFNCRKLKSVKIPATLSTSIGKNSFKDCSSLTSFVNNTFYLPAYVGESAFANCDFRDIIISSGPTPELTTTIEQNCFANNTKLSNVTFDNITFGEKMFNGCVDITKIQFKNDPQKNPQIICTGDSVFNGCTRLTSIAIPGISSYYDLHENFLNGSSITSLSLLNMTKEEVEFAIGRKSYNQLPLVEFTSSQIKKSTIYKVYKSGQEQCLELLSAAYINKLPLMIFRCGAGCPRCNAFHNKILTDSNIQDEFNKHDKKTCSILYCGYTDESLPRPGASFTYTNSQQIEKKVTVYYDNELTFDSYKAIPSLLISSKKIDYDGTNITVYGKKSKINFSSLEAVKNNENYTNITNQESLLMNPTTTENFLTKKWPSLGFQYIGNSKTTGGMVNTHYYQLSRDQKNEFFNGKVVKVHINVYNNTTDQADFTLQLKSMNGYQLNDRYSEKIIVVNDQFYIFENTLIISNINGKLRSKSYFDIDFINNNVYLKAPDMISPITYEYVNVMSIDKCKEVIGNMINYFNYSTTDTSLNPETITPITKQGNCWGVRHNCIVYDRDKRAHNYKYSST